MPGPKVAIAWRPYETLASSELGVFVGANVKLLTRPHRVWRSGTAGGSQNIRVDLGAVTTVAGVVIVGLKGTTGLNIDAGDNGTTWPTSVAVSASVLPVDLRTGVRQTWLDTFFANRYVRFSATVSAGTSLEIGSIAILNAGGDFRSWADPIGPRVDWSILQASTKLPFIAGGGEVNVDGTTYLRGVQGNPLFLKQPTVMADVFNTIGIGKGAPLIWHDNLGDASEFVICQRDEDVQYSRDVATFEVGLALEQYAG